MALYRFTDSIIFSIIIHNFIHNFYSIHLFPFLINRTGLSQIISSYHWQWLTCWSLYARCHLMHYKIYTANGYSDRSCVTFTIASMCTFRLPVFCICVVYLSIGKLRHFDLYLSKVLLFSLPPVGKMINCVRCTFSVVVVIVQIYDFTFTRNMFSVFLSTLPHSYL